MTRVEALELALELAERAVDLLEKHGFEDTDSMTSLDEAVSDLEIDVARAKSGTL